MGNSASTLAIYDREIDESMVQQIKSVSEENYKFIMEAVTPEIIRRVEDMTRQSPESPNFDLYKSLLATAVLFRDNFGYFFADPPRGVIGESKVVHNLCSIGTPIVRSQITEYVKNEVFSQTGLPGWVERQAAPEFVQGVMGLMLDNKEPTWGQRTLRQLFYSASEDEYDWKLDGMMVSVNGALTNDGLRAGISLIYFVAVFYRVRAEQKAMYTGFRREAFNSAPREDEGPAPRTDVQLSDRLERDGSRWFQTEFEFPYGSHPPGSWRAEGISLAYLNSKARLIPFPGRGTNIYYVMSLIEDELFAENGFNISIESVKQAAIFDLAEKISSVFMGFTREGSWQTDTIDRVYQPADPTRNPIRQKGILSSWRKSQLTPDIIVSVVHIFVQTMLYEEVPVEQRAMRRLFQLLSDKIRKELQKPPVIKNDLLTLKDILLEYARIKFQSTFGFAYAGNESSPPARKQGGAVRGFCEVLQTKSYPASVEEVGKWLDKEVLQRDSLTFPNFANNQIWERICNEVVGFTKTSSDEWTTSSNTAVYLHPDGGTNIKQYSLYVYAVGKVSLEGVSIVRTFVCYLGIYCGTVETS
ncbi:hypothetical protein P691DRAFT_779678 [Macrolepiota fuliginosa MF-IS2]|uniref:Uncharacterized protein n=1 Tax=Macrolepiota fuliginosa MF-IS2 TaxID=1400762 RepID=A0A9P5WZK5_9AGAR|nr:hypothetical protein P691DRAFT_779678 [Macrolepiota fuliginosa MF-IS2]